MESNQDKAKHRLMSLFKQKYNLSVPQIKSLCCNKTHSNG